MYLRCNPYSERNTLLELQSLPGCQGNGMHVDFDDQRPDYMDDRLTGNDESFGRLWYH